jgi:hypothetical protein
VQAMEYLVNYMGFGSHCLVLDRTHSVD